MGVGVPGVLSASGYKFNNPDAIAFDGSHPWIANAGGNSVMVVQGQSGAGGRDRIRLPGPQHRQAGACPRGSEETAEPRSGP